MLGCAAWLSSYLCERMTKKRKCETQGHISVTFYLSIDLAGPKNHGGYYTLPFSLYLPVIPDLQDCRNAKRRALHSWWCVCAFGKRLPPIVRRAGCRPEVSFTVSNEMKNEDQRGGCPMSQCRGGFSRGTDFLIIPSLFLSSKQVYLEAAPYLLALCGYAINVLLLALLISYLRLTISGL